MYILLCRVTLYGSYARLSYQLNKSRNLRGIYVDSVVTSEAFRYPPRRYIKRGGGVIVASMIVLRSLYIIARHLSEGSYELLPAHISILKRKEQVMLDRTTAKNVSACSYKLY